MADLEYPVIIEPLPQNEGGGFVALLPDLPGCVSDGGTCLRKGCYRGLDRRGTGDRTRTASAIASSASRGVMTASME